MKKCECCGARWGMGDFQDVKQLLLDFICWCDKNPSCGLYLEEFYEKENNLIDEFLKQRVKDGDGNL